MKIAFFYPDIDMRDPVPCRNIWDSSRGLTGSEISCLMYAHGLADRHHDVTLYWKTEESALVDRLKIQPYGQWFESGCLEHWDAACAWMRPDCLSAAGPGTFRLFNQQVSNFSLCAKGWEQWVDLVTPLSSDHARHLASETLFPREKFRVCHNGVDLKTFRSAQKVAGRAVWASSHDRGLHWLLGMYEEIKLQVPDFHLRVFYNTEGMKAYAMKSYEPPRNLTQLITNELHERSISVIKDLKRLENLGVESCASVSRNCMATEMASAILLPYPCDPVSYTETFGVTVLEACACGTVPILCFADAFDELWSPAVPGVKAPFVFSRQEYIDLVVDILKNPELWQSWSAKARQHAELFSWDRLIPKLEESLFSRGQSGLSQVQWNPLISAET